jgi:hypothetical protein
MSSQGITTATAGRSIHIVGCGLAAAGLAALAAYFYTQFGLSNEVETRTFTANVLENGVWVPKELQRTGIFYNTHNLGLALMFGSILPLVAGGFCLAMWGNQKKSKEADVTTRMLFIVCGLMMGFGASHLSLSSLNHEILSRAPYKDVIYWTINKSDMERTIAIASVFMLTGGLFAYGGHRVRKEAQE